MINNLLRTAATLFALVIALVCTAHMEHSSPAMIAPGLAIGMVAKRRDADDTAADTAADTALTAEQKKAAGQTESQQQLRAYHEGDFQTTDPVTGEPRDLDQPPRVVRLDRGETLDDVS